MNEPAVVIETRGASDGGLVNCAGDLRDALPFRLIEFGGIMRLQRRDADADDRGDHFLARAGEREKLDVLAGRGRWFVFGRHATQS